MLFRSGDQAAPALLSMGQERSQVLMAVQLNQWPVIKPRSAKMAIIDDESERLDQMQLRFGCGAGPGHIAGVRRDLGLEQNDPGH